MANNYSQQDWSIVAAEKFIRSTRDSGYKSTSSAIAELVDNALQARASRIEILVERSVHSKTLEVSVTDNGCGMDPFTLRQALRFGGSSRFNDRSGLGRFGMGLPNSSLSQARRVTVTSWTDYTATKPQSRNIFGSGMPICTYLDADEIAAGRMSEVPLPRRIARPPVALLTRSGTIVQWTRCDRLDYKRPGTICRHLTHDLSRRFRYFLLKGTAIRINGTLIQASDPLFLNIPGAGTRATSYGNEIHYKIISNPKDLTAPTGIVRVRFSELPVKQWAKLSNEEKRAQGIVNNAGVSVVRANREVDYGWFLFGTKRKENYDDWWRCEIHFDPILDEAFGLTHTKQQIKPKQYLLQALCPDLEAIARTLNVRARKAHATMKLSRKPKRSEVITEKHAKFLEPVSDIRTTARRSQIRYEFREAALSNGQFYSFDLLRDKFVLTIDPEHAFYRDLYAPLSAGKGNSCKTQTLIELLLFSASRAEATMSSRDRKAVEQFRVKWATTLETLLGG